MKALAAVGAVASTAIIANVTVKTIQRSGGTASGLLFLMGGVVARAVTPFWLKRS